MKIKFFKSKPKPIETLKVDLDFPLPECFGCIDVKTKGDRDLELIGYSKEGIVYIKFSEFFSLINQEEMFHAGAFLKIPKSNPKHDWFDIISFAPYHNFKFSISEIQVAKIISLQAENNTKLWLFLSQTNMVEVISREEPIITFIPNNNP